MALFHFQGDFTGMLQQFADFGNAEASLSIDGDHLVARSQALRFFRGLGIDSRNIDSTVLKLQGETA